MRRAIPGSLAVSASLVLTWMSAASLAQAQSGGGLSVGNPEAGSGSADPDKPAALETEFTLRSEFHAYDNLDLRLLDESSDQSIIDSDDVHNFAYSSISAFVGYQVNDEVRVNVGLGHNGLWGEDQIGGEAELSGALAFSNLTILYTPIKSENFTLTFSAGRQPFTIGGVPRDYIFDDILDALVVTADFGAGGALRVLAMDYFTNHDFPDAAFARYISGRETIFGLRGDSYTLRSGAIYENDKIVDGLDVKAYVFHADIGGGPVGDSGADVSFGGTLGNFSDNDFVNLFGARLSYTLKPEDSGLELRLFGEFAKSQGIDRKEVVARDVEISGNAFGAGLEVSFKVTEDFSLDLAGDFYSFDGPDYASDGLEFERGFVGFKGRRLGGLNLGRYAGWYPAAHTSSSGVTFSPHDIERASGTQIIHGGLGVTMIGTSLRADLWLLSDTGSTFLDPNNLDNIDPPFGYSREEFFAETRLGKGLGTEIDVQLNQQLNKELEAFLVYGVFLPGEFYEIEINKVAGSALGSPTPETFWALTGGVSVTF